VELYGREPVADSAGPGGVNPLALTYLNRLSDLLFILIRVVNGRDGDVLWVPGGDRRHPDPPTSGTARRKRRTPQEDQA
jgi:cob(I)alamin adenosyltransferase